MRQMTRSLLVRFGIPLASTFLAALLTAWLQPVLTPGRFFLFLTAVVVSAWYGGWRGGLLSTVLGALGHAYLLLRPATAPETVGPGGWLNAALFLPVALLMCWLIGALHAARRKAQSLAATLRQRVLELAEADRCKEEFLAVLGHELRNPLATIVHALHVLRFRDDPPTVQWARGVVERQANHLSRLIDDLLDRTRVSRGKIVLRRERLDLTRFLRAALDDHALDLEAAGVLLRRDLPEGPVWAEGIRRASRRSSATCSRTRPNSPTPAARWPCGWPGTRPTGGPSSPSGTPASASRPRCSRGCSRRTRRRSGGAGGAGAGSGSGWPWSRHSSSCTGAR